MKKVLFATTALVATAGVAAADVTFGGYGRFGVLYMENVSGTDETNVTSRLRLQIDMSAESDMGVSIGARARINQDNGGSGTGINGVRFFAKSGGLEVGVGNIYGALEFMPGMYPIDLGLTGLGYDYTAFNGRGDAYSSGGAGASQQNGVEVMYSMGDLSVHVSASDTDNRVAAFAAYTFSGYTVALGLQDSDSASDTEAAFSVGGNVGPAALTFAYAKNGDDNGITGADGNGDHYVLAAKFDVGAATDVEVYVADADYFTDTSYGVDFNHNLGGGTSLRGGVASRGNGLVRADLGVRFNF
ncbi:MAG: porin [Sulfitobacter sp.]|nr:porin [Sulfitobacter sp.]